MATTATIETPVSIDAQIYSVCHVATESEMTVTQREVSNGGEEEGNDAVEDELDQSWLLELDDNQQKSALAARIEEDECLQRGLRDSCLRRLAKRGLSEDMIRVQPGAVLLSCPAFAKVACDETYDAIMQAVLSSVRDAMRHTSDGTYYLHVYASGISISAATKHRKFITDFAKILLNMPATLKLCVVHNAPACFSAVLSMFKMLLDRDLLRRVVVLQPCGKRSRSGKMRLAAF